MFPKFSILSTVLLALVVSANPITVRDNLVRLPFAKKLNLTPGNGLLKGDQARAAALRAHGEAKAAGTLAKDAVISIGVQNQAVTYVASVGVGSPATTCEFFLDILRFCNLNNFIGYINVPRVRLTFD